MTLAEFELKELMATLICHKEAFSGETEIADENRGPYMGIEAPEGTTGIEGDYLKRLSKLAGLQELFDERGPSRARRNLARNSSSMLLPVPHLETKKDEPSHDLCTNRSAVCSGVTRDGYAWSGTSYVLLRFSARRPKTVFKPQSPNRKSHQYLDCCLSRLGPFAKAVFVEDPPMSVASLLFFKESGHTSQ